MSRPVLVVVAHPDDEVLGCGGTIARWISLNRAVHILFVADGENSRESKHDGNETNQLVQLREKAARTACGILGTKNVSFLNMPDNRLDGIDLLDIVKPIEKYINDFQPYTVLTHHAGDVNIDHCIVHDAVVTSCRPQPGHPVMELLFFEIASSTEWNPPASASPFSPNYFVEISSELEVKLEALQAYSRELRDYPHPRSLRAVEVLARWRGVTIGVEAAEAFVLGRNIIRN